jgi:SAM-dependent methyltransferase
MADWVSFWDSGSDSAIYVNRRHRDVHYRRVARDIRALVPSVNAVVLDYGCGEALFADHVAAAARRLILCEAAPQVRQRLAARFADNDAIQVCGPDDLAALPDGSVDFIVMHSVAQYLTPTEFDALLMRFRRMLAADGRLILGDIIPPSVTAATDAGALLGFAAAGGFLTAALVGLARTVFSDYWHVRRQLGLTRYSEDEIVARLTAAGFSASRTARNLGHNPARMTILARPA